MTFSGTVMGCIMSVNYSCWYDIIDIAASYITSSLEISHVDNDMCNITATIISPLACDFVINSSF